jgi:uncharacterized protein YdeI (YjbR/CyaY-like superfamily)
MLKVNRSRLTRKRYAMPEDVHEALVQNSLVERYFGRPPYQQNDYIGWITRAKREDTRGQRIRQMLQELIRGDRYMNMPYPNKKQS